MPFAKLKRRRGGERIAADPTSENIDVLGRDENAFRDSVDAGHRIDPRAQKIFVMAVVLLVVYALGCILPDGTVARFTGFLGDANYTLPDLVADIQEGFARLLIVLTGNDDMNLTSTPYTIRWQMLRYVVVALAGAGLALSGAVYQGAFRNALITPSTLGVMTGGQLGMTVWVLLAGTLGGTISLGVVSSSGADGEVSVVDYLNSSYGLAAMSFLGCFLVVSIVLLVMKAGSNGKSTSPIMMIITGQVIGGLLGVFSTLVRYYYTTTDPYGDIAQCLQELQVASFYRSFTIIDIFAIGIPLLATFLVVMALSQKMMILAFDKTEQRTMGVDTRRMQIAVVGLCTLLTAIIISFCGTVGFVGFLVPHMARRLVGPNFRYLLPASTVLGAVFVLAAYVIVEFTMGSSYSTMTGMYISIFGAAVFLFTALRGKGVQFGAFK